MVLLDTQAEDAGFTGVSAVYMLLVLVLQLVLLGSTCWRYWFYWSLCGSDAGVIGLSVGVPLLGELPVWF